MPRTMFRSFLRNRFIYDRFKLLEALEATIDEGRFKSKEWSREMDSIFNSVRRAMLEDKSILPVDLARVLGPEQSLLKAQSCISMYGVMMRYWEDISDASIQTCQSFEFLQPFSGQNHNR